MNIFFDGAVTSNGGDAAIMTAQIEQLRHVYAEPSFTIADDIPQVARRRFPDTNVVPRLYDVLLNRRRIPRRLTRHLIDRLVGACASPLQPFVMAASRKVVQRSQLPTLAALDASDLVYYTGGTSLVENYRLTPRLVGLFCALASGKPVVLGTQSIGPFRDRTNRMLIRDIIARCKVVVVRDRRSLDNLRETCGDVCNVFLLPDIVLSLALDQEPEFHRQINTDRPQVALSVRDWRHFENTRSHIGMQRYMQAIKELTIWLVREVHAEVCFISTCQGIPEYRKDDSLTALRIADGLPATIRSRVQIDTKLHDPLALRHIYSLCDLVVATRMHAAILAMCAGTPVVPITYEYKTSELAVATGLQEWNTDINTVTGGRLITVTRDMLERMNVIAPKMRVAVEALAQQARRTALTVKAALEPDLCHPNALARRHHAKEEL